MQEKIEKIDSLTRQESQEKKKWQTAILSRVYFMIGFFFLRHYFNYNSEPAEVLGKWDIKSFGIGSSARLHLKLGTGPSKF